MFNSFVLRMLATCLGAIMLAGCNPDYNWREVRGREAPYSVLLPARPASFSRPVNLDGTMVTMTMTAAEVNGVTFAVGSIEFSEAAQARKALWVMKKALVNNVGGNLIQEKRLGSPDAPDEIVIEAAGVPAANASGKPMLLFARLVARDRRAYQVLAVGQRKSVSREAVDTFLTSFKAN